MCVGMCVGWGYVCVGVCCWWGMEGRRRRGEGEGGRGICLAVPVPVPVLSLPPNTHTHTASTPTHTPTPTHKHSFPPSFPPSLPWLALPAATLPPLSSSSSPPSHNKHKHTHKCMALAARCFPLNTPLTHKEEEKERRKNTQHNQTAMQHKYITHHCMR